MEKKVIQSMIDTINRAFGECSSKEKSDSYKYGYCFATLESIKRTLQIEEKHTKDEQS